ncbi:DNA repair exonuclease [Candidatus Woesearchaeota archaeon]|nr:DNA repair exonuclease [Candidatus Woesearchaeota archaeon]
MKFAHIADCHLGAWREPKMKEMNAQAFEIAIDKAIEGKVDFVLIAGDLFNTAVPPIDSLKLAVDKLKALKDQKIPVYIIAGSHDFSPSGKTMLGVLESAGLVKNAARGAENEKGELKLEFTCDGTGAKIAGLIGKKGGLETTYYENLDRSIEQEEGYKIFMFHTAITELKPKDMGNMQSMPTSLMPKGFDYYAGGHVHITDTITLEGYKNIVYPGPTFPNSFSELEKLQKGTMVIVDGDSIQHISIEPRQTKHICIDAQHKTPAQVEEDLKKAVEDVKGKIVTIRVEGELKEGKTSDIGWQEILTDAEKNGAYFVMKNTHKLRTKEFERINVSGSIEEIEDKLVKEHTDKEEAAKKLMHALSADKKDGEKTAAYEERIIHEIDELLSVGSQKSNYKENNEYA